MQDNHHICGCCQKNNRLQSILYIEEEDCDSGAFSEHDGQLYQKNYCHSIVGLVWYGMAWYGMVWYGMVWYGMVWYGMHLLPAGLLHLKQSDQSRL